MCLPDKMRGRSRGILPRRPLALYVGQMLYLPAEQEIINRKSHPAECEDQDGDQDFADDAVLAGLEDVQHAPDGEDDAEDVDDFC